MLDSEQQRMLAIADILAGTQYQAPDYSGLIDTLAGARGGMKAQKGGLTNNLLGLGGSVLGAVGGGLGNYFSNRRQA